MCIKRKIMIWCCSQRYGCTQWAKIHFASCHCSGWSLDVQGSLTAETKRKHWFTTLDWDKLTGVSSTVEIHSSPPQCLCCGAVLPHPMTVCRKLPSYQHFSSCVSTWRAHSPKTVLFLILAPSYPPADSSKAIHGGLSFEPQPATLLLLHGMATTWPLNYRNNAFIKLQSSYVRRQWQK